MFPIKTKIACLICGSSCTLTIIVRALEQGMSPEMVMTFPVHKDYDTIIPYIAMTDKTKRFVEQLKDGRGEP